MNAWRNARALVCACTALAACAPEIVIGYAPASDAGMDARIPDPPLPEASVQDARSEDARVQDARPEDTGMEDVPVIDTGVDSGPVELPRPDITWRSGGHPGNDLPVYLAFGDWRGRPIDVAHVFPDRTSWDGILAPAWPVDMFAPFDGTLILSVPFYPDGMGTLALCAAGDYDDEWASFGSFMLGRDRGSSIVRLGWGMNDNEHDWAADPADIAQWVTCFQSVVDAMQGTAPDLEIDWSFNPIGPPAIAAWDPYLAYPGDDYVDYVGLEAFDMHPPAVDEAAWQSICNAPTGLCTLFTFARAHGKRVGIAEWAAVSCDGDGMPDSSGNTGGDSAFFIQKMVETFAANSDAMGYEAYFEDGSTELCSGISNDPPDNPLAAERYQWLFQPH